MFVTPEQSIKWRQRRLVKMALKLLSWPADVSAIKLLISLGVLYGLMSFIAYSVLHLHFIKPLSFEAPLDRFSESRALNHIKVLAQDIQSRQVYIYITHSISNFVYMLLNKSIINSMLIFYKCVVLRHSLCIYIVVICVCCVIIDSKGGKV